MGKNQGNTRKFHQSTHPPLPTTTAFLPSFQGAHLSTYVLCGKLSVIELMHHTSLLQGWDPKSPTLFRSVFIFTRTYSICEPLSISTAFMEIICPSQFLTHKHETLNNLKWEINLNVIMWTNHYDQPIRQNHISLVTLLKEPCKHVDIHKFKLCFTSHLRHKTLSKFIMYMSLYDWSWRCSYLRNLAQSSHPWLQNQLLN